MAKPLSLEASIAIIVSAMVANGSATLVAKGKPIDAGKKFIDGRRILGDGKTVEGFVTGFFYGGSVGITLCITLGCSPEYYYTIILAPLFALLGDIFFSFLKRRVGLERGDPLKPVDQLDFITFVFMGYIALGYMWDPILLALTYILVYLLHRATNIAAYRLGIKSKPW